MATCLNITYDSWRHTYLQDTAVKKVAYRQWHNGYHYAENLTWNLTHPVRCPQQSVYCGQLVDERKRGTESVNWRSRWLGKVGCVREWVNIIEILHPAGKSGHDTEHIHLHYHYCSTSHEHRHAQTEPQARRACQRATTSQLWRRPTKKHCGESEGTARRGMTAFLAFLQTLSSSPPQHKSSPIHPQ
jgi:hypothetical protein